MLCRYFKSPLAMTGGGAQSSNYSYVVYTQVNCTKREVPVIILIVDVVLTGNTVQTAEYSTKVNR